MEKDIDTHQAPTMYGHRIHRTDIYAFAAIYIVVIFSTYQLKTTYELYISSTHTHTSFYLEIC